MEVFVLKDLYNIAFEFVCEVSKITSNPKDAIVIVRKSFDKYKLNNFYKIGILNDIQLNLLSAKEKLVKLSVDSVVKNILAHPDLKFEDYENINYMIKNYDCILQDRKNNLRIFKNVNNKLYEIIIKTTNNKSENYLTTFHRCDESKIRNIKKQF